MQLSETVLIFKKSIPIIPKLGKFIVKKEESKLNMAKVHCIKKTFLCFSIQLFALYCKDHLCVKNPVDPLHPNPKCLEHHLTLKTGL